MRIKSIKHIGNAPVYDLYVPKTHCFAVNGGLIVHNCDALRYFAVYHTRPSKPESEAPFLAEWTQDMLEDYRNGTPSEKKEMLKMWGRPHR